MVTLGIFCVTMLFSVDHVVHAQASFCSSRISTLDCSTPVVGTGQSEYAQRRIQCTRFCERDDQCEFNTTSNTCEPTALTGLETQVERVCASLVTPAQTTQCRSGNRAQCVQLCEQNAAGVNCALREDFTCGVDLTAPSEVVDCKSKQNEQSCVSVACFWFATEDTCYARTDTTVCPKLTTKSLCEDPKVGSSVCKWNQTTSKCQTPFQAGISAQYGVPPGYDGPLPACAFDGSCRNVNDLVLLGVRIAKWLFGFIGVLAFGVFIAGGVMMIISFGNTERFKQGQGLLVGAVIGIAIVFGAFILVDFILDALGVSAQFRAI